MPIEVRRLIATDLDVMDAMLDMFGHAFNDPDSYSSNRPSPDYMRRLLDDPSFFAVVAIDSSQVVGGITAYELKKFEQERSEIYIYDLAVASSHRRQGVATALIQELKKVGAARGAYVIFVQADIEPEDEPAIALYEKLGTREEVLHFDIPVDN